MLVFRVVSDKEREILTNKRTNEMGAARKAFSGQNSYNYAAQKRYMHFFPDRKHAELFARRFDFPTSIVTFHIPKEVLRKHISVGRYSDEYTGKKNSDTVVEFAIPVDSVNPNWLWEEQKCARKEIAALKKENEMFLAKKVPSILLAAEDKYKRANLSEVGIVL